MGTITLTGKTRGTTRLTVKAGGITTDTPITVRSRNLLTYGPAAGDGLTATVNPDGSLHVTGSVAERHHGLEWAVTIPDGLKGKTVTYSNSGIGSGMYSYVIYDLAAGGQSTALTAGKSATVPTDAVRMRLRILAGDNYTPGASVDLPTVKPMLSLGDTASGWMRPDDVEAIGGGYEPVNLWPALGVITANGVTCTPNGDGSYHVSGSSDKEGWFEFAKQAKLEPGTYHIDGTIDGTGPLQIQARIVKTDGTSEYPAAGTSFTIPVGDTRSVYPRIANTVREPAAYDAVVTPRLYRID